MILDGETIKTKVVDLKELCNFVVDNFLFKIIYACKIMFEFLIFEFLNGLGWRNDLDESCRSRKVMQLCS
jgi:hypothetical protein